MADPHPDVSPAQPRQRRAAAGGRHLKTWLGRRAIAQWLVLGVVAAAVGLLLAPDPQPLAQGYEAAVEGTPANENIKAPLDLEVVDEDATSARRDETVAAVPVLYDHDGNLAGQAQQAVARAFAHARDDQHASGEARREAFAGHLGVAVSAAEFAQLAAIDFAPAAQAALERLVGEAQAAYIVADAAGLEAARGGGILLRPAGGHPRGEESAGDVGSVVGLEAARAALRGRAAGLGRGVPEPTRSLLGRLGARMLVANLTIDRGETDLRRADARLAVKPVMLSVKKGEMVVRDGERITHRHLLIFAALRHLAPGGAGASMAVGGAIVFALLVVLGCQLAAAGGGRQTSLSGRDVCFLTVLFLAGLACARLMLAGTRLLHDSHPILPPHFLVYLLPLSAGAMLVRLVLNAKSALLYATVASLTLSLLTEGDRLITLYALVGSCSGIVAIRHISARSNFIGAGLRVGLVQAICGLGMALATSTTPWSGTLLAVVAAFGGGIIAGLLTLAMTPLVEWAFGYTTDLQLLELANLNHPALKELIVQAPGSYHHSIIVGALVEAAAESVGANSLMARVMAYYHDLGKGCNPGYFVENQRQSHNPHDKLKPSMSAMIIRRHVTDGLELARKHRLGGPILAGIAQHHGTTLINYFYHRAREQAQEGDVVNEADYRYPGQKPQTREAALVMLGDSIEAASRSLQETSPSRLQGLVNKIISNKFTDGQLEECDLTLRDLHTIAKSFSRVLNSIYHHRPEYPDASGRRAASSEPSPLLAATESDGLRRLGL